MPLIRIDKASLAFGTRPLLTDVELNIEPGERIGLVGLNGAGKSTLMKVINKEVALDGGDLWIDPACRIAQLPQALPAADERRVWDVVAEGLQDIVNLRREYDEVASQDDISMSKLESLQQKIEALDGWQLEQNVERVLTQLSLDGEALMSSLSGGWRRRAALGAALVQNPDLLLLDEPTNHLDIGTIEWMEQQLIEFRGGLLFVSHDRALVDHLATRIIELDRGVLTSFKGNYTSYVEQKQVLLENEARQNALFDKKLAQEEVWIRQGIKARRTRNEGRVRTLEKLRNERAERMNRQGKASFNLEEAQKSGKLAAELEHVSVAFEGKQVIRDFSMTLQRGDRVGLIGPNGAGKSTLLKLILGDIEPDSGSIKRGTKLEVAYFDQLRGQLDMDKTVIDNISEGRESIEINGNTRHIIGYLNDFLFSPERARTPVRALSGGECNRVLLAKLFSQPANLLVLDEPTNDLDVETLELLEEILMEYKGTVLLVSHDRAFLDNVVTSTVAFEGNGRLKAYVGGYKDWLRQRPEPTAVGKEAGKNAPKPAKEAAKVEPVKVAPAPKKASVKLSYKLQRELESLPAEIEAAENSLEALQSEMADPAFYEQDHAKVAEKVAQLSEQEATLERLMERWVELEAMQEG
ncbi:ATP-binding cassette domain-containing protein [Neptunomonas phycophila]|uniref:ATP-binding cassette domain-containing protein n=1 Tax=Neptunomonas phycophila TaxID=1572645 RepID=UPI001BE7BC46|nr:ATP-binding cassette domain-containing protein [Neptunomonas phycophila]MBT3146212.1 ATP-binding cassette domain-containing protein [Neptunomonas phycophila]MDO6783118.1 ATP-binding cassette domain-containing protein [Neptunomonas phycophila]